MVGMVSFFSLLLYRVFTCTGITHPVKARHSLIALPSNLPSSNSTRIIFLGVTGKWDGKHTPPPYPQPSTDNKSGCPRVSSAYEQ